MALPQPQPRDPASSAVDGLDAILPSLRTLYEDLHAHPELGGAEHRTARLVESSLTELGYAVQRIGGTGVVGVLVNGDGPTVLARADIDAIPIREDTGLPFASTETATDGATGETVPVMHGCGHDFHVVSLVGAATLLAQSRDSWSGTYVALFQPAEELANGAQRMIDDGLTSRIPRPDVAFAQHVMTGEAGRIGIAPGPVLSAGDSIRITVHGKGSHGSMPHNSVDPVVLAAAIVLRLQTIVSRETPPGDFAVVTVGSLTAGSKSTIIADRATLLVNLRTYDAALRGRIIASIERMVRAECAASGSPREPELEYYDQYPLTSNDAGVTDRVASAFVEHFGPDEVRTTRPATASEDFSRIPDAFGIPYAYWFVGGHDRATYRAAVEQGTVLDLPANHSAHFAPVVDPTLGVMTRAHVVAALCYLASR